MNLGPTKRILIDGRFVTEFKGENGPQTPAALFSLRNGDDPLALDKFESIEGAVPSYNNWCDVDRLVQTMTHISAAWELNCGFVPWVAVGVKHGNPCGTAVGAAADDDGIAVAKNMVRGDSRAIFGGVVMTNFTVTGLIADAMSSVFPDGKAKFDGVIAPSFDDDAIGILSRVKGRCRLMKNSALFGAGSALLDPSPRFRCVRGGFLVQPNYTFVLKLNDPDMKVYGARYGEVNLLLAWGVGCTSNSNTITIVNSGMLIGNGVGQQDRVGAAELAIKRAIDAGHKDMLEGAVAYSDSFFPFPDAVYVLINAGIKAIFSTSGSVNDQAIQELCVRHGVTLYQLPDAKARGFFGH